MDDDEWRVGAGASIDDYYEAPSLLDFLDVDDDDAALELANTLHEYLLNRQSSASSSTSWNSLQRTVVETAEVVRRIPAAPTSPSSTPTPASTRRKRPTPAEKTAQAVATRLPSLLAALASQPNPVSVDELCSFLQRGAPLRGQHGTHEDAALLRAHRGYSCQAGDLTQWVSDA